MRNRSARWLDSCWTGCRKSDGSGDLSAGTDQRPALACGVRRSWWCCQTSDSQTETHSAEAPQRVCWPSLSPRCAVRGWRIGGFGLLSRPPLSASSRIRKFSLITSWAVFYWARKNATAPQATATPATPLTAIIILDFLDMHVLMANFEQITAWLVERRRVRTEHPWGSPKFSRVEVTQVIRVRQSSNLIES